MSKTYTVTCAHCKGKSIIDIDENLRLVTWRMIEQVISARFRLDNQWGFQCYCGNNTLMTKQERNMIKNHAQPEPQELQKIKDNLIIKVDKAFILEEA